MTASPEFVRSVAAAARVLGVARSSVRDWRAVGLPFDPERGYPIGACRQWIAERRAARARGVAADDADLALAQLRQTQTALAELRLAVARGAFVPRTWFASQWAARCCFWRDELAALAAGTAAELVGVDSRTARVRLEARLRDLCERVAGEESGEPPPLGVADVPADSLPVVERGEKPAAASDRWLAEKRRKAVEIARLALAHARGSLVPLAWVDDMLATRASELRRSLQAFPRAVVHGLAKLDEAAIAARLGSGLAELADDFARVLPVPPRVHEFTPADEAADVDAPSTSTEED